MKRIKKEKAAMFRFSVISRLIGSRIAARGEKESLIKEITDRHWDIPYSDRSSISRSTVLSWVEKYKKSGGRLESLYPEDRSDIGRTRSLDKETELALVKLKKELTGVSLPVILKVGRERKVLPPDFKVSPASIYRMFKRHGLDVANVSKEDRRRFEAELPNDLWQSDCMHGPQVIMENKLKKVFLFDFIDDHSRLIPHAQFYPRENLTSYMQCLKQALCKRGLPRKLYVDNGPSFRSHHLSHVTASLGIALIHCKAYTPEGKGKIERWHRTVRMQFLPTLPAEITLSDLNERLWKWIDKEYHLVVHSSTGEMPLKRYQKHLSLIRSAPDTMNDFFRKRILRKVDKDRTVSIDGKIYEAPVRLIGQNVTLLYHEDDPKRVEIYFKEKSHGFLVTLNAHINARIRRNKQVTEVIPLDESPKQTLPDSFKHYEGGKLFGRSEKV